MTTVVLMCKNEAQYVMCSSVTAVLVSIERIFLIVQKQICKNKEVKVKGVFGAHLECVPYLTVICCSLTSHSVDSSFKKRNV